MDYNELKKQASKLGINTHGLKKEEIETKVKEISSAEPALTEEKKQEAKEARTERRSRRGGTLLGKGEMKLDRPEYRIKGYHTRWFNDEGGRLDSAYLADYDFVLNKDGSKIKIKNGTNRDGTLRTSFLMKKRIDWYKEDQLKKTEIDLQKEQNLREGRVEGNGYAQSVKGLTMTNEKIEINNSVIKK